MSDRVVLPRALTELVRDISATETSLPVLSTAPFDDAGRLWIEGEQVTYTSKTTTSFEGCGRGDNAGLSGAEARPHTGGTYVYHHNPIEATGGGATGPQGPAGPTGTAGTVGTTGATGPQGVVGAASTVPGPTGPQGLTGPTGPTGTQGVTGPAGSVGGSDTHVQYNNAGVFGGEAGFAYDQAANVLTVPSITVTGTARQNAIVPTNIIAETDAAVNEGVWLEQINAGIKNYYAANDAVSVFNAWLTLDRLAAVVALITLNNAAVDTDVQIKGVTDANLLRTDAGTNRVGVGVAVPDAKLDVNGDIAIVDGVTAPSAVSGKSFIYTDIADGSLKVRFGNGTTKVLATNP